MANFKKFFVENYSHGFLDEIIKNPLDISSYMAWKDFLDDQGDVSSYYFKLLDAINKRLNNQRASIPALIDEIEKTILNPNLWRYDQKIYGSYRFETKENFESNNARDVVEVLRCYNLAITHYQIPISTEIIKSVSQLKSDLHQLIVLLILVNYINDNIEYYATSGLHRDNFGIEAVNNNAWENIIRNVHRTIADDRHHVYEEWLNQMLDQINQFLTYKKYSKTHGPTLEETLIHIRNLVQDQKIVEKINKTIETINNMVKK